MHHQFEMSKGVPLPDTVYLKVGGNIVLGDLEALRKYRSHGRLQIIHQATLIISAKVPASVVRLESKTGPH